MKKQKLIIGLAGGIIAVLIVGGVILFNHSKGASNKGNITLQTAQKVKDDEDDTKTTAEDKPALETAEDTLEKPDKKLEDDKATPVKQALTAMFNWIGQTEEVNIIPNRDSKTLLSKQEDLKTIKGYLNDGYTYSENDVTSYYSDSKNVYQFVVLLKKDKQEVAITGNWQTEVEQIQIGVFKK